MAIDLSSLATANSTAASLANLILVTPDVNVGIKPQITGFVSSTDFAKSFLFDYEAEQSVRLNSDVTDHVIENNTTIQDQIALKPETVSTSGYVGELNDIPPPALQLLKTAADRLTLLSPFAPVVSITAIQAYNTAQQTYQTAQTVAAAAVATWNTISGQDQVQTKQQLAFAKFYGYWQNRTLFTVQTPWAIFKDMVILSLNAIQEESTNKISNFEITFKKLRFANTVVRIPKKLAGRRSAQATIIADNGTTTPTATQTLAPENITSGVPPSAVA